MTRHLHLPHVVEVMFHPHRRPLPQRVVPPAEDWPEFHFEREDGLHWTREEKGGAGR